MSRYAVLAVVALSLVPVAARAAPVGTTCVNPKYSYEAHALDSHNVAVKQTIGEHREWLQLSTSCYDLKSAYRIALGSTFTCIGQGDIVVSRTIDGQSQSCRVTGVTPLASYSPDDHG
jgi:hypothetical protein